MELKLIRDELQHRQRVARATVIEHATPQPDGVAPIMPRTRLRANRWARLAIEHVEREEAEAIALAGQILGMEPAPAGNRGRVWP